MPKTYADSAASKAVSPGRTVGGPTLTLTTGDGAKFTSKSTGDPTPTAPMRIGVYRGSSTAPLTVLKCIGRTVDVLTIDGAMDGYADAAVLAGDSIEHVPFAADFDDIQTEISTIALTPGPQGPPGANGSNGSDGSPGAPGSVWREGTGAPSNGTGVDGDLYLDGGTGDVYRRASGVYTIVANIKGATGSTGSAGTTGSAGAPGSVWREGDGSPASALGVDGDYYLDGLTGDVYRKASGAYTVACNIKGPKGDKGDAGTGGGGTVTSVGLSVPSGFSVSGSPVSTSGTLAVTTTLTGVLKGTGSGIAAATAGTDYVVPSGSITGTAATITGSVTESQVTGLVADLAAKAADTAVVHLAGSETITGTKTFSSTITGSVSGSAASITGNVTESQVTNLVSDLAAKAADSAVVHNTGAETIAGAKTFSSTIVGDVSGTASNITGTAAVANGGTGLTAVGSANQMFGTNAAGTAPEYKTITAGANMTVTHTAGVITLASTGGGGGVSIGDAVGSGTATYVLYVDGSGNLGQHSGLVYDSSISKLTVAGPISSPTIAIPNSNSDHFGPSLTSQYQFGINYVAITARDGTNTGVSVICYPKGSPSDNNYAFQFQTAESGDLSTFIIVGKATNRTHLIAAGNDATTSPYTIKIANGTSYFGGNPTLAEFPPTGAAEIVTPRSASDVGLVVRGLSGQSANMVEHRDYTDTVVLSAVAKNGDYVLSTTSGTPTDTPATATSRFDPTTNKLWVYNGTAWVSTPPLT